MMNKLEKEREYHLTMYKIFSEQQNKERAEKHLNILEQLDNKESNSMEVKEISFEENSNKIEQL